MGAAVADRDRTPSAGAEARLRVLTFSSLFPSEARPRHGIFVETRLNQLMAACPVDARVIAPVPWFPFRSPAFGTYARFAATPRQALRPSGVSVAYPRYPMLPRVGVPLQPRAMAASAGPTLARWQREGWRPQLIDAHYLYPDGVAAALLAERMGLPFTLTARGTDVNVLARQSGPRERILWAAQRAAAVVTVSSALRDVLVEVGVDGGRITVLRNGVDPQVFRREDAAQARQALDLPAGPLAACVGNLVPEKGFALAVEALRLLPEVNLVVVGDGPEREALAQAAREAGVAARVHFRPVMPQARLRMLYSAADVLLLTSLREGWPNVVLESLACGTPVAAVDVGAVREMITTPAAGRVLPERSAAALAQAVRELALGGHAREAVAEAARAHALGFDWGSIVREQFRLMQRACASGARVAPAPQAAGGPAANRRQAR